MRILPKAPLISFDGGLLDEQDLFKLRPLADGMTNLVSVVQEPLVIAFDGPWGSGKTIFLRQWVGELKKKRFPVIYFDAFENDYVSDAFAALAREIVELIEKTKSKELVGEQTKKKLIEVGKIFLKASGKVAIKVGTRIATAGLATSSDFADAIHEAGEEVGEVYESYMDGLLREPTAQKETIESFKESLSCLASKLIPPNEGEQQKPLVFIIDELDRCKPMFALELLEKIKHLFSVKNVHFVLGVNSEQLRESLKVVYGPNIDAHNYLQKFISLTIHHGVKNKRGLYGNEFIQAKVYGEYLAKSYEIAKENEQEFYDASNFIISIVQANNTSLREMERIYTNLFLALAFTPPNYFRPAPILSGLCALKSLKPDVYRAAKDATLTYEIVSKALGFDKFDEEVYAVRWWQAFLEISPGDQLDDMLRRFSTKYGLRLNSLENRLAAVALIANDVIDRFQQR